MLNIVEELGDDLLVFSVAAFGDIGLEDGLESHSVRQHLVVFVHNIRSSKEVDPFSRANEFDVYDSEKLPKTDSYYGADGALPRR